MAVDYKKQYRPDQLEPFWPHEIMKMIVVVLCTLALIMFLAVLPVVLEMLGLGGAVHEEQPANPHGATPAGIKPEWYFLAVYQYLKLMPTTLLGISGKTLGVLSQGPAMLVMILLPFWYRRRASRRPGALYRIVITLTILVFLACTLWGGWPGHHGAHGEQLISLGQYIGQQPTMFAMMALSLVVFYVMIAHERRAIRRILDTDEDQNEAGLDPPSSADTQEPQP